MLNLETPVEQLNKVGKNVAGKLKHLGIFSARDLLFYYPFRYDDFSALKKIKDLKVGDVTTVKGKIELLANKRSPRKNMVITECFISDETGSLKALWFRQPFIGKILKNNDEVYFSGKIMGDLFTLSMQNPSYEKISDDTTHTARLVPIYPLTEHLTQKQIRFLIKEALLSVAEIKEWLPAGFLKKYHLTDLISAIKQIHFPGNQGKLFLAQRRLKFDELLNLHLQNLALKKDAQNSQAKSVEFHQEETQNLVKNLGF